MIVVCGYRQLHAVLSQELLLSMLTGKFYIIYCMPILRVILACVQSLVNAIYCAVSAHYSIILASARRTERI